MFPGIWLETQEGGKRKRGRSLRRMANRKIVFLCRMLNQTLNYLDHFARFTQKENVEAVERLLSAHKDLAKFERAQLGSSLPIPARFMKKT